MNTIYPNRIRAEKRESRVADLYGYYSLQYLTRTNPNMEEWCGEHYKETLKKNIKKIEMRFWLK